MLSVPEDGKGKYFERRCGCKAPSDNSYHSKGENMENVDKTVEAICNWIQKELGEDSTIGATAISDMTNALAELIKARALYA